MIRARCWMAIALAALLATAATAQADVKAQQKTQVKFEGMLGRMMGLFGGSKAKDGVVQTISVKGDRKATATADSVEIVDLAEEKVYEVNLKNKSYQVVTFAEMRKKMEEARAKAEEQSRKNEAREKKDGKEMEVDFSVKPTGQKKDVNGFTCRQVVMSIGVHEKGKTLDQAGGILMTVDNWMAPTIAGMKEIRDFDVRYARKLMSDAATDMVQAMAMYPGLKDAMEKMKKEAVNLEGTPVQTIMTVQTVVPADQAQARKKDEDEKPAGGMLGGMLGRFGKKKNADEPKDKDAAPSSAAPTGDNKTTFMTSTTDVLSVAASTDAADLQVPAGFKLK